MRPHILLVLVVLTAACFLIPQLAEASPDADEVTTGKDPKGKNPPSDDPDGPKPGKRQGERKRKRLSDPMEHHKKFLAGVKGSYLVARSTGYAGGYYGGGWFIELVPSHDWLAIEISMRFMGSSYAGVYIPIDVLFKKPFHIGHVVELYVGAGPSVSLHAGGGHSTAHFGIATVFGSYFWVSKHFGFLVEMSYIPVFTSPVTHEFGPSGGIVLGW